MVKISKNRKFKKRKLIFLTTAVLGVSTAFGAYEYNNKEKVYYNCEYSNEPYDPQEKYVWEGIIPDKTATTLFTYSPSDTYTLKAFVGKSKMTHYRIEIIDDFFDMTECTDWQEIPEDGLIFIDREDFINQYGKTIYIKYGKFDNELNEISGEEEYPIVSKEETIEEVKYFNNIRNIMVENYKKLIKDDDADFDKVKKAYDFLIKYMQYNHNIDVSKEASVSCYINSKGIYYGDCTCYTDIMNSLLKNVGVECFSVDSATDCHIWNIVKVDGKYYHLDATYSDTGSFTNTSKYRYFLVSDDFMHGENRWFVKEKDVECSEDYDLSGILTQKDIKYRNLSKSIKK